VSEPSGRDPVEQGAIPWRRLWRAPRQLRRRRRRLQGRAPPVGRGSERRESARRIPASRTNIDDRPIGEAPL